MRGGSRWLAWAIVLTVVGSACTSAAPATTPAPTPSSSDPGGPPTTLKIAFVEDLSRDGLEAWTAPAYQGARLAIDTATLAGNLPVQVEVVALDTRGDPSTAQDVVATIVDDPAFVGAIGAPFLTGQASLGDALDVAGVPMITLSTLGPDLSQRGWTTWRRAVADQTRQAAALARYLDGLRHLRRGVCLLGDDSVSSTSLLHGVARALQKVVVLRTRVSVDQDGPDPAVSAIEGSACGAVVWGGFASEGALLRHQLVEAGLRSVVFVGGEGLKDQTFLSVVGAAGVGSIAACPCVDLSTSTRFAVQRFIQDYQSDFGLPPGPYAAEGWDVARMYLQAVQAGASTREEVAAALAQDDAFDGLANTYVFAPDGELAPGSAMVHLFRDEGGRWIGLGG